MDTYFIQFKGLGLIHTFWVTGLLLLIGVGCADPNGGETASSGQESAEGALQGYGAIGGFGSQQAGGVPTGLPQSADTEGSGELTGALVIDAGSYGGDEDGHSNGGEEPGTVILGDDASSEVETETTEGPVAYECNLGDTEECITECGSIGTRQCSKIWGPCIPPEEECNQLDDNCDGQIDEGLVNECGECAEQPIEVCNGIDDDCDGEVDEGMLNQCGGCGPVPQEVCNGLDDNCDGQVDEGVLNACGSCGPTFDQEICNGMDDNCNGQVDENCYCEVAVDLSGDCLSIYCPAECPYPIGCDIDMAGGDPRGCVASTPTNSKVYFQEGNNCGAGKVTGTLLCASVPGVGLTKNTCAINKPQKFYPSSKGGCPDTN